MLRAFFREYRFLYLSLLAVIGLFWGHFFLYDMPMTYFSASFWSVSILIVAVSGYLFWRFRRKMLTLQNGHLPEEGDFDSPSELALLALFKAEEARHQQEKAGLEQGEKQLQALMKLWSHQMKIPLSALSLMVQTDRLNQQDVQLQVHHLETYLSNLLNYLKLNNQSADFRFEKVAVRDIVVDLIKTYRVQFLNSQISLDLTGDWQLTTDKKWLSFAIEQLLSNALKYNKTGGKVAIELSEAGIVIRDTGMGILPEDLPRLGEEGFTGYNGHEDKKATGLGLYMTKTILSQLGLVMHVDSQLEVGTTVRLSQPDQNC